MKKNDFNNIQGIINETLTAVWYKESQVLRGKNIPKDQKNYFKEELFKVIKRLLKGIANNTLKNEYIRYTINRLS